ncbi:unnamed protein product [Clonostachys chloroleuca]|uniref:Carboxylic ester hydrolase n=1 Tax=Clonostachys chloroleuca TaxID=1926264 RepID=A0AA35LT60_9HYPO|nr:unnamed protein product [Clonostachys chloroleuca]
MIAAKLAAPLLFHWAIALINASPIGSGDCSRPTAVLADGVVIGTTSRLVSTPHLTVHQYLGIPFAKSPPRRFMPPEESTPWNSPWDASYLRPSCFQYFPSSELRGIFNNPPPPESEDCLYLNIFVPPTPPPTGGFTVLFWIHGGTFQLGSGRLPDYDGSSIAANQEVVVVTINYRTNVFGFPGSQDIPLEQRNLGLMDQRKALAWVNKNIKAFGGDPSQVTIFGESAGGFSSQAFGPEESNEEDWMVLTRKLGCNEPCVGSTQLDCVAKVPAEAILKILDEEGLWFTPIVDNTTNGPFFAEAVLQRRAASVPILIGTNADEGSILASLMPSPEVMLDVIFRNDTASKNFARSAYPTNLTEHELKSLILTDHTYTCTTSATARAAVSSAQSVWRYYFNASFPNNQPIPGAGAWHTSEIPLVFGTYRRNNQTTFEQSLLSRAMQKAWGDFAKTPETGPGWARMGSSVDDLRIFDISGNSSGRSTDTQVVDSVCIYYDEAIEANGF